jgi:lipid II:glycine glycyltransferase (peptidoglycan interpeptide bridge formation enzyme)
MDLRLPLEDLRLGMQPHWKRELKIAERNGLEIIQGHQDELFDSFIGIYKEMVIRKKFLEPNQINQFRRMQKQLPEKLKMQVMLCRSKEGICAGVICSSIGNTAMYLFGATSNRGAKSRGSYLLQWKLLESLWENHVAIYNLNGISPLKNPGTAKFKSDLAGKNGKDIRYLGRFDSHPGPVNRWCFEIGERLRIGYRKLRQRARSGPAAKPPAASAGADAPLVAAGAPGPAAR